MNFFEILTQYHEAFERGLSTTVHICLIVWIVGIILGTLIGYMSSKFMHQVGWAFRSVSFVLTGIPVLVFLFWLHYPVQYWLGVNIDPFYTSVFTFSIINTFSVSEIIRNGINDLPEQYSIVGKIYGLSRRRIFTKIEFPLILRHVIPSILFLEVNMIHISLFASLISVNELFRVSQQINAMVYKPVEIYSALGIFFLVVSLPINGIALWLRFRFTRNMTEV